MADKTFSFENTTRTITEPNTLTFINPFYEEIYGLLFNKIDDGNLCPHIDFDNFHDESIGMNIRDLAVTHKISMGQANNEKAKKVKAMLAFLEEFPAFFSFLLNVNANANVEIKCAEFIYGEKLSASNFINIKKTIDYWNRKRWIRTKDTSESQSGVSTLGTISENLLANALSEYIDNENFFKNNTSSVQSYGDFVLMCLPNNLWMSVKSNFARERLLASGFTTDIVGVGFFTDSTEFTSGAKIRNFQKVGFLAMYVPDIPITEQQVLNETSTYSEIKKYYDEHPSVNFPLNINGKLFVRKLSELKDDIESLLLEPNIKKRVTIGF